MLRRIRRWVWRRVAGREGIPLWMASMDDIAAEMNGRHEAFLLAWRVRTKEGYQVKTYCTSGQEDAMMNDLVDAVTGGEEPE